MRVNDFIDYLKYGDTSNLTIVQNLKIGDAEEVQEAQRALISYINIGLQALHTRFNLKVGMEVVPFGGSKLINLKAKDVVHVTKVQDAEGEPLKFLTVTGAEYDIETLAFNTYLLKEEAKGDLYFLYAKTCEPVFDILNEIDLPPAFTQALIYYVAMRAYASVGGNTKEDHSVFHSRYQSELDDLERLGYTRLAESPHMHVRSEGFR